LVPALAVAVLGLAGCGGGGSPAERTIFGKGFTVAVPGDWDVRSGPRTLIAAPGETSIERVSVTTFPLARRFAPRLWPQAVRQLDSVAARLARELDPSAALSPGRTELIGGRRARVYDVIYTRGGGRRAERFGFVLSGRREYELGCRWDETDPGEGKSACELLFRSFRLA
jgi:hypothetical protein